MLHVKYADEVAKGVSEEYGEALSKGYDNFGSAFNAKSMGEEQIFKEVRKRMGEVKEAYSSPSLLPKPSPSKSIC